jgi:regulator of replication initiation timing
MFENFTTKIIDQMNTNFTKQNELMSCELFEMKKRLDNLEKENEKLRKDNENLRVGQEVIKSKVTRVEVNSDHQDQAKIKDDIIVTGVFDIEPADATKFSSLIKSVCNADIDAAKISKISSFKNKKGQSVVRVTVADVGTRISLFKNKKNLAQKSIYVSEALTATKFHLLMAAKSFCKNKVIFSAWSKNGNIFIKKMEEGVPCLITDKTHLDSIINSA